MAGVRALGRMAEVTRQKRTMICKDCSCWGSERVEPTLAALGAKPKQDAYARDEAQGE